MFAKLRRVVAGPLEDLLPSQDGQPDRLAPPVAEPGATQRVVDQVVVLAGPAGDEATLALMPSRAEGFGLVGLEAVAAGTPVLVSGRSGLGMLLREILPPAEAARAVVPVTLHDTDDVMRWGHQIAAVLRDPVAAFATADRIRRAAEAERTWATVAEQVLGLLR
ncbi:glycosyltransferase [Streptomyces sp. NPDC052236]|uniref:glycosyltransferase n=1 Tax=Streptomyces sp. NPDC052236 TaxID=3365686 RepID=UPI0037D1A244